MSESYRVIRSEGLHLVIEKGVLGSFLFAERPLFLQLWTPEGLDAVHAGAQLLCRGIQFPLQVAVLVLQVAHFVLKIHDITVPSSSCRSPVAVSRITIGPMSGPRMSRVPVRVTVDGSVDVPVRIVIAVSVPRPIQ